jgi:LPXTG-motif cell wall-anchored protein
MKQKNMKLCAITVLVCIVLTSLFTISASAATTPIISASTIKAEPGSTVNVVISLDKNPGIWSMGLIVGYDHSVLTLKSYTPGNVFTSGEVTPPQSLDKETYNFIASKEGTTDTTATGNIVTLTFSVSASAEYKDYPISLELSKGNTINVKSEDVSFSTAKGTVTVVNCVHPSSTWTTITIATCEKSGIENLICDKCKAVLSTRTIATTGHNFTQKVISDKTKRSEATATEKASYYYTCTIDGAISDKLYFTDGDVIVNKPVKLAKTGSTIDLSVLVGIGAILILSGLVLYFRFNKKKDKVN